MTRHSESPSGPQESGQSEHSTTTILVAEDPFINHFLRTVLQRRGYQVVTTDHHQGSDLMRTGQVKADVIITNKPEMFLPFGEDLPMLYIAANPDPEVALCFHSCRVLRKPFRYEDLLQLVDELKKSV
jgi:hypothetical protein